MKTDLVCSSISTNSLDPYYLEPHYYLGHIPSLFGSRWVVGYQVVGVLRVPRKYLDDAEFQPYLGQSSSRPCNMSAVEIQHMVGIETKNPCKKECPASKNNPAL